MTSNKRLSSIMCLLWYLFVLYTCHLHLFVFYWEGIGKDSIIYLHTNESITDDLSAHQGNNKPDDYCFFFILYKMSVKKLPHMYKKVVYLYLLHFTIITSSKWVFVLKCIYSWKKFYTTDRQIKYILINPLIHLVRVLNFNQAWHADRFNFVMSSETQTSKMLF